MTLEKICVSLELAEQLKKAGYPQDSLFSYSPIPKVIEGGTIVTGDWRVVLFSKRPFYGSARNISAPTAEELLADLKSFYPKSIKRTLKKRSPNIFYTDSYLEYGKKVGVQVYYSRLYSGADSINFGQGCEIFKFDRIKFPYFQDESFVNVIAEMWLYLKKNKLLTK